MEDRLREWRLQFFDDCYFLPCDFSLASFEHCNSETSKVAHKLARLTKISATRDWFEEPLDEIVSLLIDDVNVIYN